MILTLAELFALLPDNNTNEISPQDIRAIPDSVTVFGELRADAVAQGISTTPALFTAWNSVSPLARGVTPDHTTDRITIDKPGDFLVHFDAAIDVPSNAYYYFEIRKNGLDILHWQRFERTNQGSDAFIYSMQRHVALVATDWIDVFVYSSSGSPTITINTATLSVNRLLT